MNTATTEKMRRHITDVLDADPNYDKKADGSFSCEIYADYRDEMDSATAIKILNSDDPMQSFWEQLNDWYFDYECELRGEAENAVREELTADNGPYPNGFTAEEDEIFSALMLELVYFTLPEDHFLNQTFYTDILVDTGDGNYDYVLNSVYPCWYGRYEDRIDDKAAIVWLAKTQGYTKTQLWKGKHQHAGDGQ